MALHQQRKEEIQQTGPSKGITCTILKSQLFEKLNLEGIESWKFGILILIYFF